MLKRPRSAGGISAESKKIRTAEVEKPQSNVNVAETTKEAGSEHTVESTTAAEICTKETLPQETSEQSNSSQTLDYSSDTVPDSTLDPGEARYFSE